MRTATVLLLVAAAGAQQPELWIDLSGPWRSHMGDRPEYAQTDFDDRAWLERELPDGESAWYSSLPLSQRKMWLRKRVQVPVWARGESLTLTLGAIEDVYEIYVNNQRIGATGAFDSFERAQTARPRTFDLPAPGVAEIQIAIRLQRALMRPTWISMPDRGPYVLASSRVAPREAGAHALVQHGLREAPRLAFSAAMLGIALLAFLGWQTERGRRELLWFAAACALASFNVFYGAWMLTEYARPFTKDGIPATELLTSVLRWPLFAEFAIAALGIASVRARLTIWMSFSPWAVAILTGRLGSLPNFWVNASAALYLLLIVIDWLRKRSEQTREGHLLHFVLAAAFVPRIIRVPTARGLTAGPFAFDFEDIGMFILSALTLILLFRRAAADRREKHRLAEELEAARAVQQLLLPARHPATDAFDVQAVYVPVREVGGDFYWTRATDDGALLVVVADVSGKGLRAAMLVSVAVGMLRSGKSTSPATILSALNEGLAGHTAGAFVTCCCALFSPEGTITLANAGHLAPYLDGAEVVTDPGLPLGLDAGAEYAETRLALGSGRLTFLTDGVVEAENAQRELFGFDRTREFSTQSAQAIADEAKAWGQNDDITVVTVRRVA